MPTDAITWAATIKDIALSTALIIVLYGGAKRWWAFGYQLTEAREREAACKAECDARLTAAQRREDEWKELALSGGYIAKQAVDLAKRGRTP
jgi:hypothetical protein